MRFHSKERRQLEYYSQLLTDKDLVKEVKLFDLGDTFIDKYSGTFKTYFKGMKRLIVQEGGWGIGIATAQSVLNGGIFLRIAYLVYSGLLTIGHNCAFLHFKQRIFADNDDRQYLRGNALHRQPHNIYEC